MVSILPFIHQGTDNYDGIGIFASHPRYSASVVW